MAENEPELGRRERRKREVRTRIMASAMQCFVRQGFADTTVDQIADAADVAQKTFFNYFPSKRHVLREIAQGALAQLLGDIESVRKAPGTTRQRLERFFEQLAARAEQAGPMHRELLTELIHVAHEAGTESEQARKLHEAFGALIRDGVSSGELTGRHEPEALTELVMGAFYVLMFNWAHLEGYPLRRRARAAAQLLGDALAAAPEESSA